MPYVEQTWVTGETITAEKLNHMEDGIASDETGIFLVTLTLTGENTGTIDKTFSEIITALDSGQIPIIKRVANGEYAGSLPFQSDTPNAINFTVNRYVGGNNNLTVHINYVNVMSDNTIDIGEYEYTVSTISPTPE